MIAVLYSADLLAAIEACACPGHPLGGIARRATRVAEARAETDAVVVVDAGDLLFRSAAELAGKPAPDKREVARRAWLLAGVYRRIGIDALAPGDRDLALGLPLLRRVAADARLPLVSANLYGRDGGRLFDADRVIDTAGVRVGVFGVTGPAGAEDVNAWRAAGIEARDPIAAARDAAESLRARGAAIVIALVHVGDAATTRRLLEAVPGIDWAVVGHAGMRHETPERVGTARMLAAMSEGKELGRLDLHVVAGSVAFVDRGERGDLAAILADHRRQRASADQPVLGIDPASLADYYEGRHKQLETAIEREAAALARLPREITGSWFENRLLALDPATPEEPGIAGLVAMYRRDGRGKGGGPPPSRSQTLPR